jgi:hypothetical protein
MVADHQGVRDQGGVNPSNKNKVAAWTLATERLVEQPLRVTRAGSVRRRPCPLDHRSGQLPCVGTIGVVGQFRTDAAHAN